jgi:hypothetical protein
VNATPKNNLTLDFNLPRVNTPELAPGILIILES